MAFDVLKASEERKKKNEQSAAQERMERLATVKSLSGSSLNRNTPEMKRYSSVKSITGENIAPTEITAARMQNANTGASDSFDVLTASRNRAKSKANANRMTELNTGINTDYGNLVSDYSSRFGKDGYRADATDYAKRTGNAVSKIDTDTSEIMALAKQSAGYVNPEYLNAVYKNAKAVQSNANMIGQSASADADYMSSFANENEFNIAQRIFGSDYDTDVIRDNLTRSRDETKEKRNLAQSRYDYLVDLRGRFESSGDTENVKGVSDEISQLEGQLTDYNKYLSDVEIGLRYADARKQNDYLKLLSADDYDEVMAKENDGLVNFINGGLDMRGYLPSEYENVQEMTDDQKKVFEYIYKKDGYDAATKYIGEIAEGLNYNAAQTRYNDMNALEKAAYVVPAGIDQFSSGMENFGRMIGGKEQARTTDTAYTSSMIRQGISDKRENSGLLGKIGYGIAGSAYDLGTTTVNMAPSILMSYAASGLLTAYGVSANIASKVGKGVGAVAMGSSAAGNAYSEMLQQGYNKKQAMQYATLVGLSESCLEYIIGGIEGLGGIAEEQLKAKVERISNRVGRAVLMAAIDFEAEGTEEALQDILEPAFKTFLFDEKYEAPNAQDVVYSFVLGGLSAWVMNGATDAIGNITGSKARAEAMYAMARNADDNGQLYKDYMGKTNTDYFENLHKKTQYPSVKQIYSYYHNLENQYRGNTDALADIDNQFAFNYAAAEGRAQMEKTMKDAKRQDTEAYRRHKQTSDTVMQDILRASGYATVDSIDDVNLDAVEDNLANRMGYTEVTDSTEDSHAIESEPIDSMRTYDAIQQIESEKRSSGIADSMSEGEKVLRRMSLDKANAERSFVDSQYGFKQNTNESADSDRIIRRDVNAQVGKDATTVALKYTDKDLKVEVVDQTEAPDIKAKPGELVLKDEVGVYHKASNIKYQTAAQKELYRIVGSMGVSVDTANAIIRGYQLGTDLNSYIYKVTKAYTSGFEGDTDFRQRGMKGELSEIETQMYMRGMRDRDNASLQKEKASHKVEISSNERLDTSRITHELNEREQKSVKLIEKVADILGVNIHLYESEEVDGKRVATVDGEKIFQNGYYQDGEIWLDLKAGDKGEGAFLYTLSHELVHFMRDYASTKYDIFERFVVYNYREKGQNLDALIQNKIDEAHALGRDITRAEAYEEVVANSCERFLTDTNALEKIAELRKKEGGKEVIEGIKKFLSDILQKIRAYLKQDDINPDSAESVMVAEWGDKLQQMVDMFAEGVATAAERKAYFTRESIYHNDAMEETAIITHTEDIKRVVRAADGRFLVMETGDGKTYYSERTYYNGGKSALEKCLRERGYTNGDIQKTVSFIEDRLEEVKKAAGWKKVDGEWVIDEESEAYQYFRYFFDNLNKDVVKDRLTGKQAIWDIVPNGDYPADIELQLSCKKRVAYGLIMDRLIADGVMESIRYGGEAIAEVNMILAENDFETQCLGCFVEARRLQLQSWAETFVSEWNDAVMKVNPDAGYFFEGGSEKVPLEDVMSAYAKLSKEAKNGKGNFNLGKGSVAEKMERLIAKSPKMFAHKLSVSDLLTEQGLENLRTKIGSGDVFSLVKQRYGAASPKIVQGFNAYNGEITTLDFKTLGKLTGMSTPSKSYLAWAKQVTGFDQKKRLNKAERNLVNELAFKKYLYDIGGLRIQSFSDFMVQNTFDMLQIFTDIAARNLPIHGYTKEIAAVRMFGMNGCKWNGSLIAHVVASMGKEKAGLMPYTEENLKHGIAVEVDGEKYVMQFDDYQRQKAYGKFSVNTKNGSFIQSIGYKDIMAVMLDPRYSQNVGNITIGFSDLQIRAMLNNPLFRMVIPYHKSGMIPGFAHLLGVSVYNDYTDYQNTTVKKIVVNGTEIEFTNDKGKIIVNGKEVDTKEGKGKVLINGNEVEVKRSKGTITIGEDSYKVDLSFDFNEKLQQLGDAKKAATAYVEWCEDGNQHQVLDKNDKVIGYAVLNPKFSSSPNGYDFAHNEPNYYKLLEDFNVYDSAEEVRSGKQIPAMQRGVTMKYAGDEGATLTEEQLADYRALLEQTGIFTEKDIEKYIKWAGQSFDDIMKDAVDERIQYHKNTDPKMESAVQKIEKVLMEKYAREPERAESAVDYLKKKEAGISVKPEEGVYQYGGKRMNQDRRQGTLFHKDVADIREEELTNPIAKDIMRRLNDESVVLTQKERNDLNLLFDSMPEVKEIRERHAQELQDRIQKMKETQKRMELENLQKTQYQRTSKAMSEAKKGFRKLINPKGGDNTRKMDVLIERFVYEAEKSGKITAEDREKLVNELYTQILSKNLLEEKWSLSEEEREVADDKIRLYEYFKGKKLFADNDMRQNGHKDEWKEWRTRARKNGVTLVNPSSVSGADLGSATHLDGIVAEVVELFPSLFADYMSEGNYIGETDMTDFMERIINYMDEAREIKRNMKEAKRDVYLPSSSDAKNSFAEEREKQGNYNLGIEYAEKQLSEEKVAEIRKQSEEEYQRKSSQYEEDSKRIDEMTEEELLTSQDKTSFEEIYENNLLLAVAEKRGNEKQELFYSQAYDIIDQFARDATIERDYLFKPYTNRDGTRTYTEEGMNRYLNEKAEERANMQADREALLEEHRRRIDEMTEYHEAQMNQLNERRKEQVQREREKRYQAIERMESQYRELQMGKQLARDKREMRMRIIKNASELRDMLLNNTKNSHVIDELKKPVAEILDAINLDTVAAEERIRRYQELVAKEMAKEEPDMDKVDAFRQSIERIVEQSNALGNILNQFKNAYAKIENSEDADIRQGYHPEVAEKLSTIATTVGDTPLSAMTIEQMDIVNEALTVVKTVVRNANRSYVEGRKQTISSLAEAVDKEVREAHDKKPSRGGLEELASRFGWAHLKPIYAMKLINSKTFLELYHNLRHGEDTNYWDIQEGREFYKEVSKKHKSEDWDWDKEYAFKLDGRNKSLSLSLGEIMSLYAYTRREKAKEHLRVGGIVRESGVETGKGLKKRVRSDSSAYNLTPAEQLQIINTLTKDQKEYVEEMSRFLSAVAGGWGNEVSMKLYGIKQFGEENYFPIHVAQAYSSKADASQQMQQAGLVNMKSWGFTKETQPMANNPMILSDFKKTWANHVAQMALYHNYTLPMEDFLRTFKYTSKGDYDVSVTSAIENALGTQATEYINQLLKDINGQNPADKTESFLSKGISRMKKTATMLSASVWIQQPAAIGRAFKYLDFDKFQKTKIDITSLGESYAECIKYAPIAGIKQIGSFDTSVGRTASEYLISDDVDAWDGKKKLKEFFQFKSEYRDDLFGALPEKMDEITWAVMWEASKNQVAMETGKSIDSEDVKRKAGELFTKIIEETQVYDSVFSRSQIMRSKNAYMKMISAFMAEPTTSMNMTADAIDGRIARGDKEGANRSLKAVMTSIILTSALSSLIYAPRDDDDDETILEKYAQSFVGEMVDALNPLTYFAVVKDIWSLMQGFDVERTDVSLEADFIDSINGLFTSKKTWGEKLYKLAGSVGNLCGIPVRNAWRDIAAAVNLAKTIMTEKKQTFGGIAEAIGSGFVDQQASLVKWGINAFTGNHTNADKLYNAYVSGNKRDINNARLLYDNNDEKINRILRTKLKEKDERILQAAQARYEGDIALYSTLVKEIVAEGVFDTQTVVECVSSMQTKLKKTMADAQQGPVLAEDGEFYEDSIYRASDYPLAIASGDTNLSKTIEDEMIKKYGTWKKAESAMKTAMSTYFKPLYQSAYANKDKEEMKRIRQLMVDSPVFKASEVTSYCQRWVKDIGK